MRQLLRHLVLHRHSVLCAAAAAAAAAFIGCRGRTPPPAPPPSVYSAAAADLPVWRPVAGRVIILDPGHGGKDGGTSHHGLTEKDITLDLARRTAALLRARNADVLLTRDDDAFISLADRSAFANSRPGAVFLSIHINAAENAAAAGIETFILTAAKTGEERRREAGEKFRMDGMDSAYGRSALADMSEKATADGKALAEAVQRSLVLRLADRDRGVKQANLAVLRETYLCPAVLAEVGFVSHAPTAEAMASEAWRQRTAEALCEGMVTFLRQQH